MKEAVMSLVVVQASASSSELGWGRRRRRRSRRVPFPRDHRQPGVSCKSKGGAPSLPTPEPGMPRNVEALQGQNLLLGSHTPCPFSSAQAFSVILGYISREPYVLLGPCAVSWSASASTLAAEAPYQSNARLPSGISSVPPSYVGIEPTSPLPQGHNWVKIMIIYQLGDSGK